MAPKTCGDRSTDQWRSFELFCRAFELADQLVATGGSFVAKLFMSGEFENARDRLRERFETVRTIAPQSSRARRSYEVFLVGKGARAQG